MKTTRFPLLFAALLLLVALPDGAFAGRPFPKVKPTPVPPHHTTIASISADSITVDEAKASKTYKITSNTEITYKDQKATVSDLHAGMRVSVTAGADPETAARIAANEPPKEPVKPAGRGAGKR